MRLNNVFMLFLRLSISVNEGIGIFLYLSTIVRTFVPGFSYMTTFFMRKFTHRTNIYDFSSIRLPSPQLASPVLLAHRTSLYISESSCVTLQMGVDFMALIVSP